MDKQFRDFPKDIITKIMLELSNTDRLALLSVLPNLKVEWQTLYRQKKDPLQEKLREIHDKYFTETTKIRMKMMNKAYQWFDLKYSFDDHTGTDEYYDNCDVPILFDEDYYKLQDYRDSITDELYKDIYNLKIQQAIKQYFPTD